MWPRGADHRRHRRVDDHVAGHVQVGDALVGVDHGERGTVGEALLDGGLDLGALRRALASPARIAPRPSLASSPAAASVSPYSREDVGEEGPHDVPEDDRVGDLHHRGLEVHREQHVRRPWPGRSARSRNASSAATRMTVASTTSPASTGTTSCSTVVVPSAATAGSQGVVRRDDHGLLVGAEVVAAHRARRWSWSPGDQAPIECGCLRA